MFNKFSNTKELKNYTLYSLGLLVSQFGSTLYTFVISLYVLKITDSGMFFAINLAISMIPVIFVMPFAGVLADKGNKKANVIVMDSLSGLLLISLYLYMSSNSLNMIHIYLTTLILASFTSIFNISLGAAKVNIVDDKRLVFINSTTDIITSITRILGPLLGGLLFVLIDVRIFILINGASFIASAISEIFIDFKYNYEEQLHDEKTDFIEDMKDGYKYVFKRDDLKNLMGIFVVINVAFSLSVIVPLPFIVNNVLKLGSANYGIIQSALPIGIIVGALIVSKIMKKTTYKNIFKYSLYMFLFIIAIFSAVLFIDSSSVTNTFYIVYYFIAVFITGVMISCVDIPIITYLQTKNEKKYIGRVMAIVISSVKIATPLSYILSGYLLDLIKVEYVTMLGGVFVLAYILYSAGKESNYIEGDLQESESILDL